MNKPIPTEEQIAAILQQMRKALSEIKRLNLVYEKSLKTGKQSKSPKLTVVSRNV
jgi:hypothetical protein